MIGHVSFVFMCQSMKGNKFVLINRKVPPVERVHTTCLCLWGQKHLLYGSFKPHMAHKETFLSVYSAAALQSVQELRAGRQPAAGTANQFCPL